MSRMTDRLPFTYHQALTIMYQSFPKIKHPCARLHLYPSSFPIIHPSVRPSMYSPMWPFLLTPAIDSSISIREFHSPLSSIPLFRRCFQSLKNAQGTPKPKYHHFHLVFLSSVQLSSAQSSSIFQFFTALKMAPFTNDLNCPQAKF